MRKNICNFANKTLFVIVILLGSLLGSSCQKDLDKKTFTAIAPAYSGAKDYIEGSMIFWNDGDSVCINGHVLPIVVDESQNNKATIDADGVSDMGGEYLAAYPANISTIVSSNRITFQLPQDEIYTTHSGHQVIHSIMAAKADGRTMKFQNICALLHFKVNASGSGIGAKLHAIEVASNQPMCGTLTTDYSAGSWQSPSVVGASDTLRRLRFATPLTLDDTQKDIYLIVPPQSGATSFTMRMIVEDASGAVKVFEKKRTGSNSFTSGTLYHFTEANTYNGSQMKYGNDNVSANTMNGTESNPFLVYSATSWSHIATSAIMGTDNMHIALAEDIDVSSTFASDFKAILDGNGHTINLATQDISLFSTIDGGTVKNLTLTATTDVTYPVNSTNKCYGSVARIAKNNATFENCTNQVNITCDKESTGLKVGGLIGQANGCNLSYCINRGDITSNSHYIGGVVGEASSSNSINNCSNYGTITTTSSSATVKTQFCGGVAGIANILDTSGSVTDCHNYGDIILQKASASTLYIGGVFGQANRNIYRCSNKGNIACNNIGSNTKYCGGIVGGYITIDSQRTMLNCFNEGNITAIDGVTSLTAGGLIGTNKKMCIKNCYAKCDIRGNNIAGLAATGATLSDSVTISNCYYYGTLTSSTKYGITGAANASYCYTIDHCYYPNGYNMSGAYNVDNGDNNTLSSATAISGSNSTSLRDALNGNLTNMPSGSFSWKNNSDNTYVVFDIPESKHYCSPKR